jgi:hypothetical protein
VIVHDLATLGSDLIRNAIISVAACTGLAAVLLVGLTAVVTSIITGAWPSRRARAAVEYDEAA